MNTKQNLLSKIRLGSGLAVALAAAVCIAGAAENAKGPPGPPANHPTSHPGPMGAAAPMSEAQHQTHMQHITTQAQAEALIRELYQRIQNGEDFEDIARQNSDDENSIVAGGNLDWVYEGMVPPDFMSVVNATPTGEMSEPFRAQTGWHILEVLDRRIEDVTEENKRFQAENILRQRKFENELEDWLTEIRDTSYIDIKEF